MSLVAVSQWSGVIVKPPSILSCSEGPLLTIERDTWVGSIEIIVGRSDLDVSHKVRLVVNGEGCIDASLPPKQASSLTRVRPAMRLRVGDKLGVNVTRRISYALPVQIMVKLTMGGVGASVGPVNLVGWEDDPLDMGRINA